MYSRLQTVNGVQDRDLTMFCAKIMAALEGEDPSSLVTLWTLLRGEEVRVFGSFLNLRATFSQ